MKCVGEDGRSDIRVVVSVKVSGIPWVVFVMSHLLVATTDT